MGRAEQTTSHGGQRGNENSGVSTFFLFLKRPVTQLHHTVTPYSPSNPMMHGNTFAVHTYLCCYAVPSKEIVMGGVIADYILATPLPDFGSDQRSTGFPRPLPTFCHAVALRPVQPKNAKRLKIPPSSDCGKNSSLERKSCISMSRNIYVQRDICE